MPGSSPSQVLKRLEEFSQRHLQSFGDGLEVLNADIGFASFHPADERAMKIARQFTKLLLGSNAFGKTQFMNAVANQTFDVL